MNLKIRISCESPGIYAVEQFRDNETGGFILVVEDVPGDVDPNRVTYAVTKSPLIDPANPPQRIRWDQIENHDPKPKA